MRNQLFQWQVSIAMLNYQRVRQPKDGTSGHQDIQQPCTITNPQKYAHNMFHGMYNDIHIYSFIQDPDFSLLWIVEKKTLSNYCHWFMQV